MIHIKVNIKVDLKAKADKIEGAVEKGLRQLTLAAFHEWQDEAGRKLRTTRRRYQDSLQYMIESGNTSTITLQAKDPSTQWLVNALENGVGSFDMKPSRLGMAKSRSGGKPAYYWSPLHSTLPGEKKKKGQPYYQEVPFVDIPFRTGAKESSRPTSYRRMHKGSSGFIHPGFKPSGTGGPGPMRPHVVEYIRKTAADVFGPLIRASVTA